MSKRLTDAECAAEFWKAEARWSDHAAHNELSEAKRWSVVSETWRRFATHPHAHEPVLVPSPRDRDGVMLCACTIEFQCEACAGPAAVLRAYELRA